MISERCKGLNLLNYLKQKNVNFKVEYKEILDRGINFKKWNTSLYLNNKKYSVINNSKKEGLLIILDNYNDNIHTMIKNNSI